MLTGERRRRFRSVLERRQQDVEVVLDNIHDSHNASAILRTCDGFGIGAVNLLYTDHPFPQISKGVSGYTRKWTIIHHFTEAAACINAVHQRGCQIYATHLDGPARSYLDVDWTRPVALVFGNEHRGCSAPILDLADERIRIPMQGMAQSFNVSVAAGIILAELHRQRMERGRYAPSWSDEKEQIYQAWLRRDGGGCEEA